MRQYCFRGGGHAELVDQEEALLEESISQVFMAIMPLRLMFLIEDPHKKKEVKMFSIQWILFRKPDRIRFVMCVILFRVALHRREESRKDRQQSRRMNECQPCP